MADKIREAAFSSMDSLGIAPVRVLDLYAGSGAVGIEALSRGATSVDFVDRDRIACQTIRQNLEVTGFRDQGRVHQRSVDWALDRLDGPFDFIIVDPPYADDDILDVVAAAGASGAVAADAALLLGHWPRLDIPDRVSRFRTLRQRCHGDSCFAIMCIDENRDDLGVG